MGYNRSYTGRQHIKVNNIYSTTTTITEVVLIDSDIVENREYGTSNNRLNIKTTVICNTSAGNTAVISLYLKNTQDGIVDTFLGYDEDGNRLFKDKVTSLNQDDKSPDPIIETYYILKTVSIPVGSTLILEEDMFRDINFKYYDLCIVGDSNTSADIIINFK